MNKDFRQIMLVERFLVQKQTALIGALMGVFLLLTADQTIYSQRETKTTKTVETTVKDGQITKTETIKTENSWGLGRAKDKTADQKAPIDDAPAEESPKNQSKEFYLLEGLNKIGLLGQYKNAIIEFDKAIVLEPRYAAAYRERAAAYRYLKQYDKAALDFERAAALAADDAEVFRQRAIYYQELKEFDKAVADLNRALDLKPDSLAAYEHLKKIRREAKQEEFLIEDLNRLVKAHPAVASLRVARREINRESNRFDRALEDQNAIIEMQPTVPQEYLTRAEIYRAAGQPAAAENDLRNAGKLIVEAQKIAPAPRPYYTPGGIVRQLRDPAPAIKRGVDFAASDKFVEAVAEFTAAIKISPQSAAAYFHRGREYNRLYQYEAALADLNKAVELDPQSAAAYRERAVALRGLKQFEAAEKDDARVRELPINSQP